MITATESELADRFNPFAPDPNLRIWMDGELVPESAARVSVFDHGLLYGDQLVAEPDLQVWFWGKGMFRYRFNFIHCG